MRWQRTVKWTFISLYIFCAFRLLLLVSFEYTNIKKWFIFWLASHTKKQIIFVVAAKQTYFSGIKLNRRNGINATRINSDSEKTKLNLYSYKFWYFMELLASIPKYIFYIYVCVFGNLISFHSFALALRLYYIWCFFLFCVLFCLSFGCFFLYNSKFFTMLCTSYALCSVNLESDEVRKKAKSKNNIKQTTKKERWRRRSTPKKT